MTITAPCWRQHIRLLVVPGLNDSPPEHWQSWLQSFHRDSVRVVQRHWQQPDLERWATRIGSTVAHAGAGPWVAVAHSFGALALVQHLAATPSSPIRAALLVAPADPDKFGIAELLPSRALPVPTTLVLSRSDPWLAASAGRRWAACWGGQVIDLGNAGHINVASGFRTLPLARRWVQAAEQRLAREERPADTAFGEWSFAAQAVFI